MKTESTERTLSLERALMGVGSAGDIVQEAMYYKDSVFAAMNELRITADELETITAEKYWPFPTYGELLFSVR